MSEQQIINEHPSPRWNGTTKLLVALFGIVVGGLAIWQFETFIPPLVVAVMIAYPTPRRRDVAQPLRVERVQGRPQHV
ncbi:MAG: hypothetical protein HZC38_03315 [Chloroflexi bacterium]|nr:hypothetical protein [Chloroflexota bacterium]